MLKQAMIEKLLNMGCPSGRDYPPGSGPRILHFRSSFHVATSS
jgi:hypothetical protein